MPQLAIRPAARWLCRALVSQKPWNRLNNLLTPGVRSIKPGDTLTGIVREQAQISGVKLTPSEEFRWTQALANDNGIQNANAIFPGQKIQLQNMLSQWQAGQTQPQGLAQNSTSASASASNTKISQSQRGHSNDRCHGSSANQQLTQTQLHQCSGPSGFEQDARQSCGPWLHSQG